MDPIRETRLGVMRGSRGLIVVDARRSSREIVKRVLYNITPPLKKKKYYYTPDNQYSPPVVNSLILLLIRVTRES